MKFFLPVIFLIFSHDCFAQTQSCPPNSNFADGSLTNWSAYTGINSRGDSNSGLKTDYSLIQTAGVSIIPEFGISVAGIQILAGSGGTDPYGGFPRVPTINGYAYGQSILLGSTSITRNNGGGGG